jgi:hypothetical protein
VRFPRRALSLIVAALALLVAGPGLASPAAAAGQSPNGSDVVKTPTGTATVKDKLVVFLPGSGLQPGEQTRFLDAAAASGFHVLGLAYVNYSSVQKLCGKDSACYGTTRREIVYGDDEYSSDKVAVSNADSIVGRLTTRLTGSLAAFETTDGSPDWSKIIVVGHSQGAGHVGILCLDISTVSRCGLIAGPNEQLKKKRLPAWIQAPSADSTASSRWFALGHSDDNSVKTQRRAWDKLQLPDENRQIATYSAGDAHLSLVVDSDIESESGIEQRWKTLLGV